MEPLLYFDLPLLVKKAYPNTSQINSTNKQAVPVSPVASLVPKILTILLKAYLGSGNQWLSTLKRTKRKF